MSHLKLEDPVLPRGASLWEEMFDVRFIPDQVRTPENIREFGVRTTSESELRGVFRNSWVNSEFSIDMMFETWRRGGDVRVVKYSDTARIYKIIESHLRVWTEYLRVELSPIASPIEDLIELDKFASVVYDNARNILTQEFVREKVNALTATPLKKMMLLGNRRNPTTMTPGADRRGYQEPLHDLYEVFGQAPI